MRTFSKNFFYAALLVAALAGAVFVPGLGGQFLFDDKPNIVYNVGLHVQSLSIESLTNAIYSFAPSGYHRILPELTFAVDHWRAGLDPRAFKETNIFIHFLTVLAVTGFFRKTLLAANLPRERAAALALLMALLWAIHPIQVSSVLYIVQRMQTMGTLFIVLALWAYLKMRSAQMEGAPSRLYLILVVFLWVLAIACKEDSALLPAYTLAIELTLFKFKASNSRLEVLLKRGYFLCTVIALLLYFFLIVPHFWSTDSYPGRNFNSFERLLSQGRALCLYIGQIVLPLPSRFSFYYDNFEISRSLFQPLTTLPSLALVVVLLCIAWLMKDRRPLLALGIFLYFSAHIVASNIIGLELVFEHRNHFALIGAILSLTDLTVLAFDKFQTPRTIRLAVSMIVIIILGAFTLKNTSIWGNPRAFSENLTKVSPFSARAWNAKCGYYFELYESAGSRPNDPNLDNAISACEIGGRIGYAASSLSNVVLFKTIRGDVTDADWDRYIQRISVVSPSPENTYTVWVLIGAVERGVPLEESKLLKAIDIVTRRSPMDYVQYARIGFFILEKTSLDAQAFEYFEMSVHLGRKDERFVKSVYSELEKQGHSSWVEELKSNSVRTNS